MLVAQERYRECWFCIQELRDEMLRESTIWRCSVCGVVVLPARANAHGFALRTHMCISVHPHTPATSIPRPVPAIRWPCLPEVQSCSHAPCAVFAVRKPGMRIGYLLPVICQYENPCARVFQPCKFMWSWHRGIPSSTQVCFVLQVSLIVFIPSCASLYFGRVLHVHRCS